MAKEKSKLKKEADKPDLKPLKKIKKHRADKPQLPSLEKLTPHSDSVQTIRKKKKKKHKLDDPNSLIPEKLDFEIPTKKKKKHKSGEPNSLNSGKLNIENPDFDSVHTKKKKKKKPDEPKSLSPEKLDIENSVFDSVHTKKKKKKKKPDEHKSLSPEKQNPDFDCVQTQEKKKKHKSDEPKSLNPENLDIETPNSDSVQKKKKKKHKLDKPLENHTLNPEKIDCNVPECDSIQTTKKKKKHKADKPQFINPEEVDSIQILTKKRKSEKPQSPNPDKSESKSPDFVSIQPLERKKKKKKSDKPQKPHSPERFDCEIDAASVQTLKKERKQELGNPQSPQPEILDSQIETDSIRASKKKKQKLDKPHSLNPEIVDSKIDHDSGQTQKKKRKHDLDKLQSLNTEILDSQVETDPIQTPKEKKQKPDECQQPQSVNPEIPDPDSFQNLLEPHTKDQLIEFLLDSAVKTPSIFSKIIETADQDISHRKIFVHNLDWDTRREALVSVFEQFGELEACDVVYDRSTGKTKGFGFVTFKSRVCAKKALKEPKKRIDNRTVSCQLASIGPPPVVGSVDNSSRKIYVSNVEKDVDPGKLRVFFEKFGEIEAGPLGFDMQTGKSKGYALFVYKNLEGVRKVLEEPNKIFDGKQLSCRMANDWNGRKKNSKGDSSVTTVMMPVPHDLSAVLPKQNMAMVGQQAGFNPMLGQSSLNSIPEGLYANQSAGLLNQLLYQAAEGLYANPNAGLLNQLLCQAAEGLYANPSAGLLNQQLIQAEIGANQYGQMGVGFGDYGGAMAGQGMGSLAWNQSGLGSFSGSTSAPMLQGWQHAYSDT
ncbi:uncharacterized protein LOC141712396 [Apium graveolens]|uniref:uncharacterized protein LOC141712396 n=1 Tax=Apium graveolens TaxID=4045 RepID=UPI003D7AE228